MSKDSKERFSGSIGVILAAVGSAIGLGNIWKFPYITGVHGGSAFVIVYLGCIAIIGVPLLLTAFIIGRKTRKDPVGAYRELAPGTVWGANGWLAVAGSFTIITFYSVVAGWALYYAYQSAVGGFSGLTPDEIGAAFGSFTGSVWKPLFWQLIFMGCTAFIVLRGVKKGIEHYSRLLMPLLFILLFILDIRAVTLEGADEGLRFLFEPNFSKLTFSAILSALGHAFFTLSIGGGTMITYGSYIKKKDNLLNMVVNIALTDTLIALLAGVAIFPAVFAFGVEPSSGPGLVFVTLPNVFNMMPLGRLCSFVFFVLLFVAALTSAISLIEPSVSYLITELKWARKKATVVVCIITTMIGALLSQGNGSLSGLKLPFFIDGRIQSLDIFGWVITLSDQMLPVCGFFSAILVGWYLDKKIIKEEASSEGLYAVKYFSLFIFVLKFIVPAAIALIFLTTIFGLHF